jgi:hypothetical protein
MRQRVFGFAREALTKSRVVFDPAIDDEVVRLMAAVIVATCGKSMEQDHDDDEPSGYREDHD